MELVYIYKLECTKNGRVYIGKTARPSMREKVHMSHLRCGRHPIELMQSDYDKYGANAFTFTVLEEVEKTSELNNGAYQHTDTLREKELMIQFKSYLPEYGYNYKDHYFYPVWGPHRKFRHTAQYTLKKQQSQGAIEKEPNDFMMTG